VDAIGIRPFFLLYLLSDMTLMRLVLISGGVALCTLVFFLCQVCSAEKIKTTNYQEKNNEFHNITDPTCVNRTHAIPESSFTETPNQPAMKDSSVAPALAPVSPAVPELTLPLFYRIPPATIEALSADQKLTIVNLQNAYLKFFEEWNRAPGTDQEVWNQRMKDFHEEMVRQLGSEMVDSLVK
jgi:hypothetical protein